VTDFRGLAIAIALSHCIKALATSARVIDSAAEREVIG
jgi:hypothetical protein